jgi:hypothetical protein
MDTTSSQLPICIHCGTPRPADESLCPTCGKPWIDTKIETPTAPEMSAASAAASTEATAEMPAADAPLPPTSLDDTGEFFFDDWTDPPEEKRRSAALWLIPVLLVAAAAAAVWAIVFLDGGTAPTTTTVAALPEVTTTTAAVSTTQPEETPAASSTTSTTSISFAQPSDWPPSGEAIATSDLTLKASGIGPIAVGSPAKDAAGALTASLGEADTAGIGELCPGQEAYWLQWGALKVFFDGDSDDSAFLEYRYEDADAVEPHAILMTLSGVALGDTVADLQSTYTSYTVSFEVIDSRNHFRLSDGGELLLWGPISSTEPSGTIEGIYSPSSCG